MPTHFRWLWYLVGLAGMALTIVGILAILGSAAELGILVPIVVGGAIAVGYGIIRFRRSINAALAAAPSRQAGATPPTTTDPETAIPDPEAEAAGPPSRAASPSKPTSGPARTSRR